MLSDEFGREGEGQRLSLYTEFYQNNLETRTQGRGILNSAQTSPV